MLAQEQVRHFKTFGFVNMREVFTKDELDMINREIEERMVAAYADDPFDGTQRHWVPMFNQTTPFFANLLEDPRLCEVAEQLYGDDTIGNMRTCDRWREQVGLLYDREKPTRLAPVAGRPPRRGRRRRRRRAGGRRRSGRRRCTRRPLPAGR